MAGGTEIARLYAVIGADTKGLDKGLGSAKKQLQGIGGDVAKSIIGFASLSGAVLAVGKMAADSVNDWANYADSMRLSAQMAGITTDEMSRLAQAADDFRVPIESMQSAMNMALKNGFVPTIENIAVLSDKLNAISDPAERAAAAAKIFGKSYADIMPFLSAGGDAIRKTTDDVSDSLVVTKDAAQKAKEYKDALDELGDAWTGAKNKLGQELAPAATKSLSKFTELIDTVSLRLLVLKTADKALEDGKVTWEQWSYAVGAAIDPTRNLTGAYEDLIYQIGLSNGIDIYKVAADTAAAKSANDSINATVTAVGFLNSQLDNLTNTYQEQKNLIGKDLVDAYGRLQSATDNYRGGVAGSLVQGLKDAGLQGDALITKLELVDKYAGTNYATEYKMELDLPDLLKTLIEDPERFTEAAAAYDKAFLPLQEGVKAAQTDIDAMKANLASLERSYFTHYFVITHNISTNKEDYTPMPVPLQQLPVYGPPAPKAAGGPVYDGSPYLVGERGPELFVPESSGSIIPNGQTSGMLGGNSELLSAISNLPTAKDIARAVRDAVLMVAG